MKIIPLTKGKVALVDDDDFKWLSEHRWHAQFNRASGLYYAARKDKGRKVYMHREIMKHNSRDTDHEDGNSLNNQKHNLRPASRSQNNQNARVRKHTSRYKGVCFYKRKGKWMARIYLHGKQIFLGYFTTPEAAATAYDKASIKNFGSFARTNHQIGVL